MEIIGGNDPIGDIITLNPGKTIGKYNFNYNKITDIEISLHAGHIECINQLRSNVDIVILEFFNTIYHYKLLVGDSGFKDIIPILDQTSVLDICTSENLDIDYVVYDAEDLKNDVDEATITLVDDRLIAEDYKNKLNMTDFFYDLFRLNIINFHKREHVTNLTFIRSYKTGVDTFALKHYMDTYLPNDNELMIIHPIMYDEINHPITTALPFSEINDDAKDFINYFYNIEKLGIINDPTEVQNDLEQYANSIEGSITNFEIIDDPVFVGVDKIFISASFMGIYNTTVQSNRWL